MIGFLVLFSVVHFDSTFPDSSLQRDFVRPATSSLDLQRSNLVVSHEDAEVYRELERVVSDLSAPQDRIFAVPDCPQVTFLTGRKSAGRWMYEFFHESWQASGESTIKRLIQEGVEVIVVNERPAFSGSLPSEFREQIESSFRRHEVVLGADDQEAFSVYVKEPGAGE